MGLFDKIDDALKGLKRDLDDAFKDIGDKLFDAGKEIYDNTVLRVDDILKDIWSKLSGLPENLAKNLMRMFRDPKFWQGILMFIGMVGLAEGLAAAVSAPAGQRMAAFRTAAKLSYGKLQVDFLTKAHKLAYIFSEDYRESFQRIAGEFSNNMYEAGVDVALFGEIISDVGVIVESTSALIGIDYDGFSETWAGQLGEIMETSGDLMTEWGKDPNKMIDWLDKNVVREAHNKASAFITKLSGNIEKAQEVLDGVVKDSAGVVKGFTSLAKHLDELTGSKYSEAIAEDVSRFNEVIIAGWNHISKQIGEATNAMEFRILQTDKNLTQLGLRSHSQLRTTRTANMKAVDYVRRNLRGVR